jgi:hypothetical protein
MSDDYGSLARESPPEARVVSRLAAACRENWRHPRPAQRMIDDSPPIHRWDHIRKTNPQSVKRTAESRAPHRSINLVLFSRPFHGLGCHIDACPSTQSAGLLSVVRCTDWSNYFLCKARRGSFAECRGKCGSMLDIGAMC